MTAPLRVPPSGELTLSGRIMPASNATFLGSIGEHRVVYKPIAGERPLWDFPDGTLAGREVAAYHLSQALGWGVVPHTWLGDGPHGPGMVQLWQDVDEDQTAVDLVRPGSATTGWLPVLQGLDADDQPVQLVHEDSPALRRMAIFDVVANNSDRKGGHVLAMSDGSRLGVDHGLTFHHEPKLRTVLWGWAGAPLTATERRDLEALAEALADPAADLNLSVVAESITRLEYDELRARVAELLETGEMPHMDSDWPTIPWPPF